MSSPIEAAIRQIVEEKGLSYESVMETIEAALAAAYRKDFGNKLQNIEAKFNAADAGLKLWDVKLVVEDQELPDVVEIEDEDDERGRRPRRPSHSAASELRGTSRAGDDVETAEEDDDTPKFNPKTEIMETPAQELEKGAKIGDVIRTELDVPSEFGRMAAMTAKQVITQKLREAEREVTYNEYKEQEGEVLIATVQRRQGRVVLVDLGRGTAIMRPEEQLPGERYNTGERIKIFIKSVDLGMRGPEILVSRTAPELVLELFKVEIPEIADGTVKIEAIAREPGSRSKVAVSCEDDGIDPIGACIGQRGARIQTIIAELGGEKVDIIEWDDDPGVFVMNSLAPAKVDSVDLDDESKVATVTVDGDQLSLAIGKGGQNVRLAARLTDWRINVAEVGGAIKGSSEGAVDTAAKDETGAADTVDEAAADAQIDTAEVKEMTDEIAEANDNNDDLLDAADEEEVAAEEAQEGLEAEEMPSVAMEAADDAADEVSPPTDESEEAAEVSEGAVEEVVEEASEAESTEE